MEKHLIVNADDFGLSAGVNRGIVECHREGIVTSASLMVTGTAAEEAVAAAEEHRALALGLHFDLFGEDERSFDTDDLDAVSCELERQLVEFERMVGRPPTHVDSHRHVHREPHLLPAFQEVVRPLGIPVRGDGSVRFVGDFYAQWEWGVTDLSHVSVGALERLLRDEIRPGWSELSCHPGYLEAGCAWVYGREREAEVATLVDPSVRARVDSLGITLRSYADFAAPARLRVEV